MFFPTLYKRTSTGATQIWKREVDGSRYRTISGQIDGKQVTSAWTQCEAKNVGRANEVTPEDQAIREVEADYKKKLAQGGYHDSVEAIDEAKYFKPMLAKDYTKYPVKEFKGKAVFSQPKLDGVRCIVDKNGMWSRTGKPIPGAPHIFEQMKGIFKVYPDLIFDGELYTDRLADDFNEIIRLVKKQSEDKERRAKSAELIQYHVYDLPSVPGTFSKRNAWLNELLDVDDGPLSSIVNVDTAVVQDAGHLDALYASYMAAGYEGQMVRLDEHYKNSRSGGLLKRKEFNDSEYEIVSINEGIGNRSGMAGSVTYKLPPSGTTFDSGIKGSHDFATQLLKDSHKYKTGTVRYQNLTPDGVPRFPITVAFYEGARDI